MSRVRITTSPVLKTLFFKGEDVTYLRYFVCGTISAGLHPACLSLSLFSTNEFP